MFFGRVTRHRPGATESTFLLVSVMEKKKMKLKTRAIEANENAGRIAFAMTQIGVRENAYSHGAHNTPLGFLPGR